VSASIKRHGNAWLNDADPGARDAEAALVARDDGQGQAAGEGVRFCYRGASLSSRLTAQTSQLAAIRRDALERWRRVRSRGLSAEEAARAVGTSRGASLYRWEGLLRLGCRNTRFRDPRSASRAEQTREGVALDDERIRQARPRSKASDLECTFRPSRQCGAAQCAVTLIGYTNVEVASTNV
jgi:hypothetical protein